MQQVQGTCFDHSLLVICMQITEDDEQRTFHFECGSSEGPLGGLQAEIIALKRRTGVAEVVFRKDSPLKDDDIAAMSSAMRTANTLIKPVSAPCTLSSRQSPDDLLRRYICDVRKTLSMLTCCS